MFETYTETARNVLKQAAKISAQLGQNYIGTEHILMALVKEQDCAASQLLTERKVEEKKLWELVKSLISTEGATALKERPGYTPRAEFILEEARREAARFHE